MGFKECTEVEERQRFVIEALSPRSNMTQLCHKYGVSRKTGYKWVARFEQDGVAGLRNRSRRPLKHPWNTSVEMVLEIISIRTKIPHWGPYPIRAKLLAEHPAASVPSERSIGRIIERAGLSRKRIRARSKQNRLENRIEPSGPNDLWTIDFKGWWRTQDGTRCDPLTIRDGYSKFLIMIEALTTTRTDVVQEAMTRAFEQYGLPKVIRSDNGAPFASTRALCGLTRLSVWWLSQGIHLDRSRPGHPQDNGAHERMHQDVADVLEANPARTIADQQDAFDVWRHETNVLRHRRSLDGRTPATVYQESPGVYMPDPPAYTYAGHFEVRRVKRGGTVMYLGKDVYVSQALAGRKVGLEPLPGRMVKVWFQDLCLGVTDRGFESALRPVAYEPIHDENEKEKV